MNAVKRLREGQGLTQQELAARAGLRQQYVSHLETGRIKNPAMRAAMRLAAVLSVTPDQLMAEESAQEDAAKAAA